MSIYSKESFIFFCYHTLSEYSLTNNKNEFLVLQIKKNITLNKFQDIHFMI